MTKPTQRIEQDINLLCEFNNRTAGMIVDQMYLGSRIFIASLKPKPKIINGIAVNVDKTIDIFDLMEQHQNERN